MSTTNPTNGHDQLDAGVFRYMAELGQASLSSFVGILIKAGDTEGLRTGLDAGLLDDMPVDTAAQHCGHVLLAYAKKKNGKDPSNDGADDLHIAKAWLHRGIETNGPRFTEEVLRTLVNQTFDQHFTPIIGVLVQPEFRLDLTTEMRLTDEEAAQYGDTDPRYSLLGKIADNYSRVGLNLIGQDVQRFPYTMALPPDRPDKLWVTLNLAEQTLIFHPANGELITHLTDIVAAGSEAQRQLGDLALTMFANQDEDFLSRELDAVALIAEKCERIHDARDGSCAIGVALLGSGAEFTDPEFAWDYVRGAQAPVSMSYALNATDIEDGEIPLAHLVLHINPEVCPADVGAKALSRMITEGGVSPDIKDCGGRTLLQAAASLGRQEAVEALLNLGANPKQTGDGAGRLPAAKLADKKGHSVIAKMIRAHEAHGAVASVFARHKLSQRPPTPNGH